MKIRLKKEGLFSLSNTHQEVFILNQEVDDLSEKKMLKLIDEGWAEEIKEKPLQEEKKQKKESKKESKK